MSVAIVDYGSGNLKSAEKAFERAARDSGTGAAAIVTADPDVVARADRIVLPGVGAFADCAAGLEAVGGMVEAIREAVEVRAVPFFGICVGTQLMGSRGMEKAVTRGLGWITGDVVKILSNDENLKIPQIGWNTLDVIHRHPVLDGIATGPVGLHAYFVHSYHLQAADQDHVIATTDYGGPVTAIVGRDNMIGTQFHPEKSQKLGLTMIANFLRWTP